MIGQTFVSPYCGPHFTTLSDDHTVVGRDIEDADGFWILQATKRIWVSRAEAAELITALQGWLDE